MLTLFGTHIITQIPGLVQHPNYELQMRSRNIANADSPTSTEPQGVDTAVQANLRLREALDYDH